MHEFRYLLEFIQNNVIQRSLCFHHCYTYMYYVYLFIFLLHTYLDHNTSMWVRGMSVLLSEF